MIIDSSLQFAGFGTSVAGSAGTSLIGSQIDLWQHEAVAPFDAPGLSLIITVGSAIVTGGSAGTLQFALASDNTAAISTTTSQILYLTPKFATGSTPIPAGTVLFACRVPTSIAVLPASRRFLGILEIIGTTAITAGAISAWLTGEPERYAATAIAAN